MLTTINFKNSFCSINIDKLLETILKHKLHTKVIDEINIYDNEKINST